MPDGFFTLCYFIGLVAEGLIRLPYARMYRETKVNYDLLTMLEKFLLFIAFLGMFFIPILYALPTLLDFADYTLPLWVGWAGVALIAATVWLFWRSHADLGRNWSPTLQIMEGHTLVSHGVYKYMRHPMYGSMWLLGITQIMLLQNWIGGPSNLIGFLPMYILRVPREERMMLDRFGEEYKNYMEKTGRIIPKL